jgi:dTDP-4-amino-4,6-dideoxygalactose transaminase
MDGLMALAGDHDFVVIEDCAQAHGATYKGRPVGGLGHVAAFSFCQDKIMTTGGEGGMLVTNDEAIWKKAWSIKDHGKNYDAVFQQDHPPGFRWLHDSFGTNMRMTEMQSAIGRLQLKKLTDWNRKRNDNAAQIVRSLSKYSAISVPFPDDQIRHAYYRLYAFVDDSMLKPNWDRDRVMQAINSLGIPCFSGSCPEIYGEKAFEANDLRPSVSLPNATSLGPKSLAFLIHPTLTADDLERTRDAIESVMSKAITS